MKQWMTALLMAVALLASTSAFAENEQQQKLDDATTPHVTTATTSTQS